LSYECGQIDKSLCLRVDDNSGQYQSISGINLAKYFGDNLITIFIFILFIILLVLGLWYAKRKKDVTVVLFLLVGSFIYHDTASAGTMTWTGESHEMCDESIFGRVSNYWDTAGKCNMLTSKVDVTVKNKYYIKNTTPGLPSFS
jgi:hypothetical protein